MSTLKHFVEAARHHFPDRSIRITTCDDAPVGSIRIVTVLIRSATHDYGYKIPIWEENSPAFLRHAAWEGLYRMKLASAGKL